MGRFADWALGKVAKVLHFYYEESQQILERDGKIGKAQTVLRAELREALIPHKGRRIMLIAHFGDHTDFKLPHFVTIGSPLGLPHVKAKILEE